MRNFFPFLLFCVIFGMFSDPRSAPITGELRAFKQPDGGVVTLRLYGDEFYIRAETQDGYTVIRDKETGWICYATLSSDNTLVSTGRKVLPEGQSSLQKRSLIPPLPKHLKADNAVIAHHRQHTRDALFDGQDIDYRKRLAKRLAEQDSLPSINDTSYYSGTIVGLVLVWDFPDEPITNSYSSQQEALQHLERIFNSLEPEDNSLRYYFRLYSDGKLDLIHIIKGVYRAPYDYAYYDQLDYGDGHTMLIDSALYSLEGEGFDFTQLSTTDRGRIRSLCISNTGDAQTWAEGMWMHSGWIRSEFESQGIRPSRYCTCSEQGGALHHEMGHLIGNWPDLYSSTGEETGTWGLMGGGYTDLPNPYFLYINGWLEATNLANLESGTEVIADGTNHNSAHVYFKSANPDEFFFIKPYTRQLPLSSNLPDQGLTIWHINTNGDNFTYPETPLMVELVHANNDITNKRRNVCFKASGSSSYSDETIPSAQWRDDSPSGLNIFNISHPGSQMTFQMGAGLKFIQISSGIGGSTNPSGLYGIKEGERFVMHVEPDQGYECTELILDDHPVDFQDSLVIPSVAENHTIEVTYSLKAPFSGDGQFFIRSFDGAYIMPAEGADDNGTPLIAQRSATPAASTVWDMTSDETMTTISYNGSQCADIYGGSLEAGGELIIWRCHGEDNQRFIVYDNGSGWHIIRSVSSGLVLETENDGIISYNTQLTQQPLGQQNAGQLFRIIPVDRIHQPPTRIEAEDYVSGSEILTGIENSQTGFATNMADSCRVNFTIRLEREKRINLVIRYKFSGESEQRILLQANEQILGTIEAGQEEGNWSVDSIYTTIGSGNTNLSAVLIGDETPQSVAIDWLELRDAPTVAVAGEDDPIQPRFSVSGNTIRFSESSPHKGASLYVFAANGRCVKQALIHSDVTMFSLTDLPAGYYLLRYIVGKNQINKRFVKLNSF